MNKPTLFDAFDAETQELQSTLLAATTDLTNPLGDLVRAQIKRSAPPIYGAVVLTVANSPGSPEGDRDLRHKRILLAAALEMLHIALNVHRLLVNAALGEQNGDQEASLDRSFIGSTILAGDYCFSRAAQLAAQTDHPRVVAAFALALQTVSEELLREQFHPDEGQSSYDETRHLLQSGAHAAALLAGLAADDQEEAIALSQELAAQWSRYKHESMGGEWPPLFSSRQQRLPANWHALHHWLNLQRTNGELPTLVYPPHR